VRYAQSLGYKGFKELQAVFQRRLSTAAPGFDARVRALEAELGGAREGELGFLADLVTRDVASLQDLLASMDAATLATAAELMEGGGHDLSDRPVAVCPGGGTACAMC
jgi:DNA-binding MurR/RpiR family transcriptional regulator